MKNVRVMGATGGHQLLGVLVVLAGIGAAACGSGDGPIGIPGSGGFQKGTGFENPHQGGPSSGGGSSGVTGSSGGSSSSGTSSSGASSSGASSGASSSGTSSGASSSGTSSGGASSSGSTSSGASSSGGTSYAGQAQCQSLLAAYNGTWSCPSSLTASAGSFQAPMISAEACLRDSYVDAAIQYCWAAECYSRLPPDQAAMASMTPAEAAAQAQMQLAMADELCSSAPTVGTPVPCSTTSEYPCP